MPPRSKARQRRSAAPEKARKPGAAAAASAGKTRTRAAAGESSGKVHTKALGIREPVRRERVAPSRNTAADLEYSLLDRQLDYVGALLAWTPTRVLLAQNAAFWAGVSGSDGGKADAKANPAKDGGDGPGKTAAPQKPSRRNTTKGGTAPGAAEATDGKAAVRSRAKRRG
ncbi:hypothetical protein [Hyphomicrobium sp. D-2]|uniref:hypothetical protein n=1 Tax=Hyphomicrobium sp. D-2 TaxID=3041621 RepID=UPI002453BAC0|nr:hypothetical protein [Hyphomicrobium sp. D-2]MDH4981609.1 hypothetical protein [Hyphomicrobium sp. D-2]